MNSLDTAFSSETEATFEQCETVIREGLQSFVEVGRALLRIREKKYYQAQYGNFADYCQARWNLGTSRVYQLINATYVMDNLSAHTQMAGISSSADLPHYESHFPRIESQVRPLSRLSPEQQIEAWKTAVERAETEYPTGKEVSMVVEDLYPSSTSKSESNEVPLPPLEDLVRAKFQCPDCIHPVLVETKDMRLTIICQIHEQELALQGVLNE
ncbi:MAG: hypothetical protein HQM13_05825 [SAR324 cluster bacterium]|nr:hypothetical protein [SAR324 cluster bacterium]